MKIAELFEKKMDVKLSTKSIPNFLVHKNLPAAGSGVQTAAYFHKKYPNLVVKVMSIDNEQDAAYQFTRLAYHHQDNPFFPKIKTIKMYDTKYFGSDLEDEYTRSTSKNMTTQHLDISDLPDYRQYTMIVVMEKLYPLDEHQETSVQLLQSMGILPEDLNVLKDKIIGDIHQKPLHGIKFLFRDPKARKVLFQHTNNPMLKQAMRLMEPLFRKYFPDVHGSNIMLRRTKYGPQVVFVDPVVS